ncbi:MAG: ketopantoate reductase family protein, partial [Candidatus Baltobacteraceae bacterium]
MHFTVAVVGAGAIGGFIAAALARSGNRVAVVARGAHLAAMRASGSISVASSDLGAFEAPVQAARDLRELPPAEYVLLTFKSHQWEGMLEQLQAALEQGATIVTLQNGMPFWYSSSYAIEAVDPGGVLQHAIPPGRIIGGVVHASGHIAAPGVVAQSGGMLYPLGELDGSSTARIMALAQAFAAAGLNAPVEPAIRRPMQRRSTSTAATCSRRTATR